MSDNNSGPYEQNENHSFFGYDFQTKPADVVTVRNLIVSALPSGSKITEKTIEVRKVQVNRTTCTNPIYEKDLSFATRYAYDFDLFTINKKMEQAPPVFKNPKPQFTPWRQRFELGLPEPMPRNECNEIMEDIEPHNLLQDQAGYLGSGPAPYPRSLYRPPSATKARPAQKPEEEKPIVIPMDFLNDPLPNIEACLQNHEEMCDLSDLLKNHT